MAHFTNTGKYKTVEEYNKNLLRHRHEPMNESQIIYAMNLYNLLGRLEKEVKDVFSKSTVIRMKLVIQDDIQAEHFHLIK